MANRKEYRVFRLRNPARRELYYGSTKDYETEYLTHFEGAVAVTAHWKFEEEGVRDTLLEELYTKSKAAAKAASLRAGAPPEEFAGYALLDD